MPSREASSGVSMISLKPEIRALDKLEPLFIFLGGIAMGDADEVFNIFCGMTIGSDDGLSDLLLATRFYD